MAAECADCGLDYGGRGWIDAVIPKETWIEISPTGNEGGLLCITCMAGRLEDRGLENVTVIIGSGPFVYSKEDHRTGDRMMLKKFADYVPRSEPADFLAGGKRVNIDTLEIRVIPDGSTAASALQAGEVDYMQYAPFDLLPLLEKTPASKSSTSPAATCSPAPIASTPRRSRSMIRRSGACCGSWSISAR